MKIKSFIIFFCISIYANSGSAQIDKSMLIYQIAGNNYERKNYDKDGNLKSYQTINVGEITKNEDDIIAKLTVNTFDDKNILKGASQTTIICNPISQELIMGVFPFAGGASNKSLKLEMSKSNRLYPIEEISSNTLNDIEFQLKFKGGAAGFFGTRSKISLKERSINKSKNGIISITGKMMVQVFIIGIKIKTIKYEYTEDLISGVGIVKQFVAEDNGTYFTTELITK